MAKKEETKVEKKEETKVENIKDSKETQVSTETTKQEENKDTEQIVKQYDPDIQTDIEGLHYSYDGLLDGIIRFINFSGSSFTPGAGGPWLDCVEKMGKWYEENIHTYQGQTQPGAKGTGKHWYHCPLINAEVGDDCSGFVQACLKYFGVDCPKWNSTEAMNGDKFMKLMESAGFTHLTGNFTPDNSQPGDILCGKARTHTEIYAGNNKSWGWGNVHDRVGPRSKGQGMPAYFAKGIEGGYIHCWRKT